MIIPNAILIKYICFILLPINLNHVCEISFPPTLTCIDKLTLNLCLRYNYSHVNISFKPWIPWIVETLD